MRIKKIITYLLLLHLIIFIIGGGIIFRQLNKLKKDENNNDANNRNNIQILVTPHQNAVNDERLKLFKLAAENSKDIKNIIVLSTDHFSFTGNSIRYTSENWQLPDGSVEYGKDILSDNILGKFINDPSVQLDHGISNLLNPIYTSFPNAKILPILIGSNIRSEKLEELLNHINDRCNENCLIVASVDFSHYLTYPIANVHDRFSARILYEKKYERTYDLEVDSPQVLYIITKIANIRGLNFQHTLLSNSAELMGSLKAESTGHVLGYFSHMPLQNTKVNESLLITKSYTFSNLDEKVTDINSRYLYGTDKVDNQLTESIMISNVRITPTQSTTTNIGCDSNILNIDLGYDRVVTIEQNDDSSINIYPHFDFPPSLFGCASVDGKTKSIVVD